MFCDECHKSKTDIHYYECECLPSFHVARIPDKDLVASRIICKVRPKDLLELFKSSYFNSKERCYGKESLAASMNESPI